LRFVGWGPFVGMCCSFLGDSWGVVGMGRVGVGSIVPCFLSLSVFFVLSVLICSSWCSTSTLVCACVPRVFFLGGCRPCNKCCLVFFFICRLSTLLVGFMVYRLRAVVCGFVEPTLATDYPWETSTWWW
jgi:hypothetical protein